MRGKGRREGVQRPIARIFSDIIGRGVRWIS